MRTLIFGVLLALLLASAFGLVSPAIADNERAEENGCRGIGCCKNSMPHRQDQSRGPTSCECFADPKIPGMEHRDAHSLP